MKHLFLASILLITTNFEAKSQNLNSADSLKMEILRLNVETDKLDLRMQDSRKRFQAGILVSTLGYSVTIAGGLMLGRENDKIGQGLLVAGGVTGITGTYLLMDAFNILAGRKRKK